MEVRFLAVVSSSTRFVLFSFRDLGPQLSSVSRRRLGWRACIYPLARCDAVRCSPTTPLSGRDRRALPTHKRDHPMNYEIYEMMERFFFSRSDGTKEMLYCESYVVDTLCYMLSAGKSWWAYLMGAERGERGGGDGCLLWRCWVERGGGTGVMSSRYIRHANNAVED